MSHILMVDDDVEWLQLNQELLQGQGFAVTTATDGVEALKAVIKEDVDVILCDMMMPNMAGDMFYQAIERTKPHLCHRFIVITGHEGHPKVEAFIKRTKTVVLYKPVNMAKLMGYLNLAFKSAEKEKSKA
jgi:DNA-binding NtrC family response regulator